MTTTGIILNNEILYDIKYIYQEEYSLALKICEMINNKFDIRVDKNEASFITLHIVNSEMNYEISETYAATAIIDMSVSTVEDHFKVKLSKEDINFLRFISHLQLFAKRLIQKVFVPSKEKDLLAYVKSNYSSEFQCSQLIKSNIEKRMNMNIKDEECVFLTIHIARLLNS